MSTDSNRHDSRGVRANDAADWFLRLQADEVSDSDLAEWLDWCSDPENLREFQRTRNAWRSFDEIAPAATALLETLDSTPGQPSSRWSSTWVRAIAASVTIVAVTGGWYAFDRAAVGDGPSVTAGHATIQPAELPDGSILTLAPSTRIDVSFDATQRKLALSHGDAYFKVHPDKTKPFIVQTGDVRVTAVGTAFDVRSRADRVTVTVEEGVVEVMRMGAGNAAHEDAWRVGAGYQISYNTHTNAAHIAAVNADRAMAWRQGRLEYFSEPLGSVVADVSRYSARSIEIDDPQLAELSFTGTVFTDSIDDWLGAVESTFPVRIVVTQNDHIVLSRRATTAEISSNR